MHGDSKRRYAVLLMGPTGAGKSDLALALAERLPLEIVSVDSALVYRGMDIGTAKPSLSDRARVAHHLIDIRDPAASYSVGEFTRDAQRLMQDIWRRGKHPLLVGGTMLYFHALTTGIAQLPEADPKMRADIDAQAAEAGWAAVHRELAEVDPQAAARIHVNDPQRIQRALEVFRLTGETITELQQQRVSVFSDVNIKEFAIAPLERAELHTKIEVEVRGDARRRIRSGSAEIVRKGRFELGTSIHARGRISTDLAIFGRTQCVERGGGTSDCGDASTRQTAAHLAAAASKRTVVGFDASGGCKIDF